MVALFPATILLRVADCPRTFLAGRLQLRRRTAFVSTRELERKDLTLVLEQKGHPGDRVEQNVGFRSLNHARPISSQLVDLNLVAQPRAQGRMNLPRRELHADRC